MSRWFRFYDDAVNDPKVQRLPGEKFKAWVNLLCLASKNNGALPALADIAFSLRLSAEKASALLDEFCAAGLIDPIEIENAPMSYEPHNWGGRQFKSDVSNERVKRYRQRKCNVTETPPETETETETEKKEERAVALVFESDWPKEFRDEFWREYPRRIDKSAAFKKLEQIRRGGEVPWVVLIAGVRRYAGRVRGRDQTFTKGPAAWLNAGKWDDEDSPVYSIDEVCPPSIYRGIL